ncbi:hypothetical protein HMPREF9943_00648 [Eggerthia catenaformis OT 569 = DSM 20559]|uniref:Virulence-associated protein E-like domain-containing protein n=1 Tax=Eggerthia catenaformis OT 569 = DSM 20559 TaxID=999415 RepID=M2Q2F3_9FIRM|nr:VapE domain-containing protein [Eggerthia catenaformis]EMD17085.1 hypothetical protein HMPREF9943_00648 [Eggerthia catenaformis OT 569 = DSM 20559]
MNNWLKFDDVELSDYVERELEITEKGQVKSTATNLITVLINPCFCKEQDILMGNIFFDTCSRTVQFYGRLKGEKISEPEIRNWNDHMTNILGVEIEREFGIKYAKNKIEDAITFVAHKRTVNLPAMYMKSLSYDGKAYIKNLLSKYLGAEDTKLNAWIMEHILVGMVKRVFNPGCKFDELMVLTGIQGVGKTSFIEKLALLPEWYCSLNNIKGKDAVSNLVGKIVVELEEFVALRNAKSADEAKLFISARTSTVRLPYERFSTDVKRTCILIATTNDGTFLGDFSGERRYLPVEVMKDNIQIPIMYDTEKFSQLEKISRKEHEKMIHDDFKGAVAEALYIYENNLHDFTLPKELRNDLNIVIQMHKNENRHVQNFYDFMEWKTTKSDKSNLLCSAEFTSRYPETNEKVFSELMANEMLDEWRLEPSVKSKKVRIDGVVRVSKKFYKRNENTDFIEVDSTDIPF